MTSRNNFISGRYRQILRYVVKPQHEVCSRCSTYGHSRESTSCPIYNTSINYCHPSLTKRCSRCNQPGHNRNNRRCSLYQSYRNHTFDEIYGELSITDDRQYINDMCGLRKIKSIIYDVVKIIQHAEVVFRVEAIMNDPDLEDDIRYMCIGFYRIVEQCQIINNGLTFINVRDTSNTQRLYDNVERLHEDVLEIFDRLPINILFMINRTCAENGFHPLPRYETALAYREYSQRNLLNTPSPAQLYPKVSIIKQEITNFAELINNCSVCFEDIKQDKLCLTNCNHIFCVDCVQTYHKTLYTKLIMPCPMCRTSINSVTTSNNIISL